MPEYYKKYFFLPSITPEGILDHIVSTTHLCVGEIEHISKVLTTDNVRALIELNKAICSITDSSYITLINNKITQYIEQKYFKSFIHENICIETETFCDDFTCEGVYFYSNKYVPSLKRRIKVDVIFYNKRSHDLFKLKCGKLYSELQEIVQEL